MPLPAVLYRPMHVLGMKIAKTRKLVMRLWMVIVIALVVGALVVVHPASPFEVTPAAVWNRIIKGKGYRNIDISKLSPNKIPLSHRVIESKLDGSFLPQGGCQDPQLAADKYPRANAALVVLSRAKELDGVIELMKLLERHFNQWFNYPWVFLNDVPFDDHFKETVQKYTRSKVEFGVIPQEKWDFPADVDRQLIYESIESQGDRGIMYGNLESYHKMCRFYLGAFYDHELVKSRDWYWRVEPDVEFYCDITYDPFVELERNNKTYGFTILLAELYYTVPGLFMETKKYINKVRQEHGDKFRMGSLWNLFLKDQHHLISSDPAKVRQYDRLRGKPREILQQMELQVVTEKFLEMQNKTDAILRDDDLENIVFNLMQQLQTLPHLHEDRLNGEEFNLCHFWSNFEIARTDLFQNPLYRNYFQHLEDSGGFYRERWGDAPVHSLGAGLMLNLEEVHYFRDIGYRHSGIVHCPRNSPNQLPYVKSDNYIDGLMTPREEHFWAQFDKVDASVPGGTGCRCRCPPYKRESENRSACLKRWSELTSDDYKPKESLDLDHWEEVIRTRVEKMLSSGGTLGGALVLKSFDGI